MRITTDSIDRFLQCLDDARHIWCDTVRLNIGERPLDAQKDCVRFEIVVQASAIVRVSDEESYLLEGGEICGVDYRDATQETTGSVKAAELEERVRTAAAARGWKVLPGLIEL
jgi:hypothetical protein